MFEIVKLDRFVIVYSVSDSAFYLSYPICHRSRGSYDLSLMKKYTFQTWERTTFNCHLQDRTLLHIRLWMTLMPGRMIRWWPWAR